MSNPPPFSDSLRGSPFLPPQSTENSLQLSRAPKPSSSSETSSDVVELSALSRNTIASSPYRDERIALPVSSSAPGSLRGLVGARPFPASSEGHDVGAITAEGSTSQDTSQSHRRVSFDGNRNLSSTPNHNSRAKAHVHPLLREAISPTIPRIESLMKRSNHSSDPTRPPSIMRLPAVANAQKQTGHEPRPTGSASHSRATSPLRHFGWSGFHRAREDAFIPVDPFQLRTRLHRFPLHSPDIENNLPLDPTGEDEDSTPCCIGPLQCIPEQHLPPFLQDARYFILDSLPRQAYLLFLLCLPSMYFSRIARVYEDAQLSRPDLERMIESYSASRQHERRQQIARSSPIPPGARLPLPSPLPFPDEWTTTNVPLALIRFKQSWEAFIDSLLREWKTLNLVSALLHSAIISMFQIQVMANDSVIRTAALLSLTSALISLSFGCMYIVRFGTMRSMYKATKWAEESARTTTFILWNVWVLLAMPAVWLAWSMIFFIFAVLSFVWRYGSSADPTSPQLLSPTAALGPRIVISALFFLGFLYFMAVVRTFHNYGKATDELFARTTARDGIPDTLEDDTRGRKRRRQKGRGTSNGRDVGHRPQSTAGIRGQERSRDGQEQEATQSGVLSAVTGLGLTGLDESASPRSSEDIFGEKQRGYM